jgi:hypothetical protein
MDIDRLSLIERTPIADEKKECPHCAGGGAFANSWDKPARWRDDAKTLPGSMMGGFRPPTIRVPGPLTSISPFGARGEWYPSRRDQQVLQPVITSGQRFSRRRTPADRRRSLPAFDAPVRQKFSAVWPRFSGINSAVFCAGELA